MKITIINNKTPRLGSKIYINNREYIIKEVINIIKRSKKTLKFYKTTIVRVKKLDY